MFDILASCYDKRKPVECGCPAPVISYHECGVYQVACPPTSFQPDGWVRVRVVLHFSWQTNILVFHCTGLY